MRQHKKLSEHRTYRGLNRDSIIAASVYIACSIYNHPRTAKEIAKIKRDHRKLIDKKWRTFQKMYMSIEERLMTYEQWLQYYNIIIKDEFRAVMNSEPKDGLIDRYLREIGYRWSEMDLVDPNIDLKLEDDNSFALVNQITLINLSQMYFVRANYSNATNIQVNLTEGDRYAILINTLKGDYGIVTLTVPTNIQELELEFKSISKDLVSIEMFSKKAGL